MISVWQVFYQRYFQLILITQWLRALNIVYVLWTYLRTGCAVVCLKNEAPVNDNPALISTLLSLSLPLKRTTSPNNYYHANNICILLCIIKICPSEHEMGLKSQRGGAGRATTYLVTQFSVLNFSTFGSHPQQCGYAKTHNLGLLIFR